MAAGNAGKIASVIIGAIVIFSAGMAAGNIFCMKRYGLSPRREGAEDDEFYDGYEKKGRGRGRGDAKRSSDADDYDEDYDDGNDDGFYTKPGEDYTVGGDDDYLTAVPVTRSTDDSLTDYFGSSTKVGSRDSKSSDFGDYFGGEKNNPNSDSDDDDYPELFAPKNRTAPRIPSVAPNLDDVETIFGKFSGNVERNVDDGYGGISSSRSGRERSERSRRNR